MERRPADADDRLQGRAVKEPLIAINHRGVEPADAGFVQFPRLRGRSLGASIGEHDPARDDRARRIARAGPSGVERAAVVDRDLDLVVPPFDRLGAELQRDRLVLVPDPAVRLDVAKPGDHAGGLKRQGRLREHLSHDGERHDRQPEPFRIERRDPSAAQRVLRRDRVVQA